MTISRKVLVDTLREHGMQADEYHEEQADAVLALLAAQEAAPEVEWATGFAGDPTTVGPVMPETEARRRVSEWAERFPEDGATIFRRNVTAWQEVPADE